MVTEATDQVERRLPWVRGSMHAINERMPRGIRHVKRVRMDEKKKHPCTTRMVNACERLSMSRGHGIHTYTSGRALKREM